MTSTLSTDLCTFAHDLRFADLPASAREATATTTGNALCLMAGAARHPAVETAVTALGALSGPDAVPLLGRGYRLAGTWAALAHGIAGHVEDFDDTHPPTIVHPGAPVVAAALSSAVRTGASGADLLAAVAAGVEVALRVGLALVPDALDRGWHLTGIAAPVGAAVAAGRLLGLDPDRQRAAIGLAATQSAGLIEALGTMAKPLQPGKAAAAGFEAAVLAEHGLDGPAAPVEGRRGLLALHAGRVDGAAAALDGLGERWELERNEIKPYACGVVSHALIDVAAEAGRRFPEPPSAVRLTVNPFVLVAMGRTAPANSLAAKFSATHCFAVGYRYGHADPAQFADDVVTAPEVVALRDRCELVADESVPRYGVRAEVTAADGEVWRAERDRPAVLDAAGVRRKALALTEPVLGERAAAFVDLAFDPAAGSVAGLLAAGVPGA
ncbi:MmgE/PrpD family protein [Actinophytocola gossypii]|uniref:MmgE/PrpD family protein n=1 Tax=Actinophytocola gossypii TaxID=2812003 RepID=A0ABT2J2R1_9PSEU|nr:MmgE/PrpD family protein [Actinophytocola gossypii]MCT2582046.1 MmgE/PrpD family protein [Actinophytocola gossypii]